MAKLTVQLVYSGGDVIVAPNPVPVQKDDEVEFVGVPGSNVFVVFHDGSPFATTGPAPAGVQVLAPRVHKVPANTSVRVINVDEGDQKFECHLVDATGDHIGKGGGETHPIKNLGGVTK
jgi:hypothetical protein